MTGLKSNTRKRNNTQIECYCGDQAPIADSNWRCPQCGCQLVTDSLRQALATDFPGVNVPENIVSEAHNLYSNVQAQCLTDNTLTEREALLAATFLWRCQCRDLPIHKKDITNQTDLSQPAILDKICAIRSVESTDTPSAIRAPDYIRRVCTAIDASQQVIDTACTLTHQTKRSVPLGRVPVLGLAAASVYIAHRLDGETTGRGVTMNRLTEILPIGKTSIKENRERIMTNASI